MKKIIKVFSFLFVFILTCSVFLTGCKPKNSSEGQEEYTPCISFTEIEIISLVCATRRVL